MLVDLTHSNAIPAWKDTPEKPAFLLQKARSLSDNIKLRISHLQRGGASLFEGAGACALYFFTRYEASGHKDDLLAAKAYLAQVNSFIADGKFLGDFTYRKGLTGSLYLLRYLAAKKLIASPPADFFSQMEHTLFLQASSMIERQQNSLMDGSFGVVRYFVNNSIYTHNKKYAKVLLHKIVSHTRAHHPYFYISDYSIPQARLYPGMDGGQCSYLMVLLEAFEKGILAEKMYEAIEKSIQYIMQFREEPCPAANRYFFLPRSVNIVTHDRIYDNEVYYGLPDLSFALLLHRCSVVFDSSPYYRAANALGSNSLMRLMAGAPLCPGADFITGAAGVAQCYKTLYDTSPSSRYLHGYHIWIQNTVHFLENISDDTSFRYDTVSLLDGLCGTGLVLLSFLRSELRDWSKVLLL